MPRAAGTGCITCRIRRVKCDETKPSCQRCLKSQRKCDGYLPESSTVTRRQLAAARQLSRLGPSPSQCPAANTSSGGRTASSFAFFDVFRNSTAPSTALFLPSVFWTRELLQLAHVEPAVWHAVVSLGALHQRAQIENDKDDEFESLTKQAVGNHGRAMRHARQLKDPGTLLALSLALVSTANVLGRWSEGQVHIIAAQRLLGQTEDGASSSRTAAEMLTRLDLQAMTFSDSSAPYNFRESSWSTSTDKDVANGCAIENYDQAGTQLFALFRRLLLLDEALVVERLKEDEFEVQTAELARQISNWERRMGEFEKGRTTIEPWYYSIRLYHTLLRLFIEASYVGPETRWDNFLTYFERIVACVEVLTPSLQDDTARRPLSLEPGLIIPLFVVTQRCRHPILRQRALHRLRNLRTQEGSWPSEAAAAVAQIIIDTEGDMSGLLTPPIEEHLQRELPLRDVPWETWAEGTARPEGTMGWAGYRRLPEVRRVRNTLVMASIEQKKVELSLIMAGDDDMTEEPRVETASARF